MLTCIMTTQTRSALGRVHLPPTSRRQRSFDASKPRVAAAAASTAPNTSMQQLLRQHKLKVHSIECIYLRQVGDNGLSTPQNHALLQQLLRQAPNTSMAWVLSTPQNHAFRRLKTTRCCFDFPPIPVRAWDFPDIIKFHFCSAYAMEERNPVPASGRTMIRIRLRS